MTVESWNAEDSETGYLEQSLIPFIAIYCPLLCVTYDRLKYLEMDKLRPTNPKAKKPRIATDSISKLQ